MHRALLALSSVVSIALADAVSELRAAFDHGRCGDALFAPRFDVLVHAGPFRPTWPLAPPSFADANAPPKVEFNVSLPRVYSRLYAGCAPFLARGGLDTVAVMTRMMLSPSTGGSLFESSLLTLVTLFLHDKSTARSKYACSQWSDDVSTDNEPRFDEFNTNALQEWINQFIVHGLDDVALTVRDACPTQPAMVRGALANAQRSVRAASRLARFIVDVVLSRSALDFFNPHLLTPAGSEFRKDAAGLYHVDPPFALYMTPHPQTARIYGKLLAVFEPTARAVDLPHSSRNSHRFNYSWMSPGKRIEASMDSGEVVIPGYMESSAAAGLELRQVAGDAAALPYNGVVQREWMPIDTAFLKVTFAGAHFIAVIRPPDSTTQCIQPFASREACGSPAAPYFVRCSVDYKRTDLLLSLPRMLVDDVVPVAALIWTRGSCRAATALLALLNRKYTQGLFNASFTEQAWRVVRRMNDALEEPLWLLRHGATACERGIAFEAAHTFAERARTDSAFCQAAASNATMQSWNADLSDAPEVWFFDPPALVRMPDASALRFRGLALPLSGRARVRIGAQQCMLECTVVGALVPTAGQPETCAAFAKELLMVRARQLNGASPRWGPLFTPRALLPCLAGARSRQLVC